VLSRRSQVERELNSRALALQAARARDIRLWDLTESNPTRAGFHYAAPDILSALADPDALHYEPSPLGMSSARDALARLWQTSGFAVEASQIMLTASTSEAYSFLFELLCDPGDEVLVPRPSYPLLNQLAQLAGVQLREYRLAYDGAWYIDFDSLRMARTPRSRAVLLITPNNPTGSFVKRDELHRLCELGLPIISDEVFGAYPLRDDPERADSALEAQDGLVFCLGGLSKFAGLPQLKLAWMTMAGPEPVLADVRLRLEHIADAFLSVSTPVQVALPRLLAASGPLRAAIQARSRQNLDALELATQGSPVTALRVEGGWYAVLRLPAHRTEEEWVLDLLDQAQVLVEPGFFYDFESEAFVVVSLITPEPTFSEGIARLVALVRELC
jgi:alanine-synthesizing transaminase